MTHRAPWECTFAKEEPSRCLPGKRPRTDRAYFEVLSLCILQAGLSWASVRSSWPRYRRAFFNFEVARLAHAAPAPLLRRKGALRNPKKVAYLRTVKSDKDACAILQERFRHVGPYTAEFYLQRGGAEGRTGVRGGKSLAREAVETAREGSRDADEIE